MNALLLDTSALIYWTLDSDSLSERAAELIDHADSILISSISLWEIGLKAKIGKLSLPTTVDDYNARLQSVVRAEILPVTAEIWLQNLALDWDHRDPADRTLVATAMLHDCLLVTSDQTILTYFSNARW